MLIDSRANRYHLPPSVMQIEATRPASSPKPSGSSKGVANSSLSAAILFCSLGPMAGNQESDSIYTLAELVARWGKATEDEILIYLEGISKAKLVAEGADVATPRIDKDAARVYGNLTDFLATATDEQRNHIPALTDDLVRCAIWAAHQAMLKYDTRVAARSGASATKEARVAEAIKKLDQGKARRDQLRSALRLLAGQEPARLQAVETAYGTAADAKDLANALEALVEKGRAFLADKSPAMVARRKGSRLSKAWLDGASALAGEVRKTGDLARSTLAASPVSQTEVDYWDGMALALFDLIIDMCDSGNKADPMIPRLVPIALRSYFSPSRRKSGKGEPAEGASAPAEPS